MNNWISVKDAVPPDDRDVLVCTYWSWISLDGRFIERKEIEIGQRVVFKNGNIKWRSNKGGFISIDGQGAEHNMVTHWMALPEKPLGN